MNYAAARLFDRQLATAIGSDGYRGPDPIRRIW